MKKKYCIGIDLGGTNLKVGLFDARYGVRARENFPTGSFSSPDALIGGIVHAVQTIIAKNNLTNRDIAGVGIGLPGPIDVAKGKVHFFPNIPGWQNVSLKKILIQKIKLPVSIDNDANLMTLAEYTMGAAKLARNAVCLTLGTGVGGGLIIEGRLYRGSSFAAGEIGHMPINERGPECNCGGIACLESYVGNRRIMRQVRAVFGKDIPLEVLSRMAKGGNKKARLIWETVGRRLGVALVGVVNLLNPDCIVIGGGVANAGPVLFDAVEQALLTHAMIVQAKKVKIVKAQLGSDAGMIGACLLVRQQFGRPRGGRETSARSA